MNNALDTYDFNELKKELDYMYYVNRAADLLDMQWTQLRGLDEFITDEFDYFN